MSASPNTILVSAYLSGHEHATKLRYFEKLDQALRPLNYHLLLVNLVPGRLKTSCKHVSAYSFTVGPHRAPGSRTVRRLDLRKEIRESASVEAGAHRWTAAEAETKLLYFRAFMRRVFREHRPALCVLWNQFNGHHLVLADLCQDISVPVAFAEYGLLPGTIVFETGGQMALSWVAQENERFLQLPVDEDDVDATSRYLDLVKDERRTRKPQPSSPKVTQICEKAHQKGRKVLFYPGEHGNHSGILPRGRSDAARHSPFFEDTADALATLSDLAASKGWHVLFKPHPLSDDRNLPDSNEYLSIVPDANIFECIEQSDLTVTILSQACYLSVIHGRACVLLGRNPISGKGCVYEIGARHDTGAMLQEALDAGFTDKQKAAWRKHAAQLLRHYLFSMEDDIGAVVSRGPDDAANYLAQLCSHETSKVGSVIFGDDVASPSARLTLAALFTLLGIGEPLVRKILFGVRGAKSDRP